MLLSILNALALMPFRKFWRLLAHQPCLLDDLERYLYTSMPLELFFFFFFFFFLFFFFNS